MPSGWYKNLWRFMSNPLFNLDITKDYNDISMLCKKNEYLMKAFVDDGFRNEELQALNFVRKFFQAVTLADISTVDGKRIDFQAYAGVVSNGLREDLLWPEVLPKEEMPVSFIILWKFVLDKCLVNNYSCIKHRLSTGKEL